MANSALDSGVASWGFVVVSVDYIERGEVTQLPGQKPLTLDPPRDRRLMLASLDLVTAAKFRPDRVDRDPLYVRARGDDNYRPLGTDDADALLRSFREYGRERYWDL